MSDRIIDDNTNNMNNNNNIQMNNILNYETIEHATTTTSFSVSNNNNIPTIWGSRYELLRMIRPNNIPGIILFHLLGIRRITIVCMCLFCLLVL